MEVFFCVLTNYSWARVLPGSVFFIPSDIPLRKIYFPFASKYQIQIASRLE